MRQPVTDFRAKIISVVSSVHIRASSWHSDCGKRHTLLCNMSLCLGSFSRVCSCTSMPSSSETCGNPEPPRLSPFHLRANRLMFQQKVPSMTDCCYRRWTLYAGVISCNMHFAYGIFFPSKYISLKPHRAAPVLEISLDMTDLPFPSIGSQPFTHLVEDNVFIRHWSVSRAIWRNGNDHAMDNDSLLDIAVVSRKSGGQPRFAIASLELFGNKIPLTVTQLVMNGFLSLHLHEVAADNPTVQFVLHDVPLASGFLKNAMTNFLGWLQNYAGVNALHPSSSYDCNWVYDTVRRTPKDKDRHQWLGFLSQVEQVEDLHVTLRPYQQRAVAWMLSRELADPSPLFGHDTLWPLTTRLSKAWGSNGIDISRPSVHIVSSLAFHAASSQLWFGENSISTRSSVRIGHGGLLCDEMGLGKTVELMQLVLCNRGKFSLSHTSHPLSSRRVGNMMIIYSKCAMCGQTRGRSSLHPCIECERPLHWNCAGGRSLSSKRKLLCRDCSKQLALWSHESALATDLPRSRATLVIVPSALLLQWKAEIDKHVKSALIVEVYEGLKKSGYTPMRQFIEADVVLSTYDALRADVAVAESLRRPRSNLRHSRQYFPTPIPLLIIRWHRLALDESQMLGSSSNTNVFRMASLLHAKYRWCVTGTPVYKDLSSTSAMMSILRSSGGNEIAWSELCRPTTYVEERKWVAATLRKIMWRTMKIDVESNELDLPSQIVEVVRIKFGPVERFHYRLLQSDIATVMARMRNRNNDRSKTLSWDLLNTLRQACCHPWVGTSGRRLLLNASRQTRGCESNADRTKVSGEKLMDIKSVLTSLISKTQLQFQESLRSFVASVNGLAGIGLIHYSSSNDVSFGVIGLCNAVAYYREALKLAVEVKSLAEIDSIQKMHILFNLSDAISKVQAVRKSMIQKQLSSEAVELLNSLGNTLRESSLMKEFEDLRLRYLNEARSRLQYSTVQHEKLSTTLGKQPLIQIHCEPNDIDVDEGESSDEEEADRGKEEVIASQKNQDFASNSATKSLNSAAEKLAENGIDVSSEADDVINGSNDSDVSEAEEPISSTRRNITWWEIAMAQILEDGEENMFLQRVELQLSRNSNSRVGARSISQRFHNFMSIATVLESELSDLQAARNELNAKLKELPGGREPTEVEVSESGMCMKCREAGQGPPCAHCQEEELMRDVESRLYAVTNEDDLLNMPLEANLSQSRSKPRRSVSAARSLINGSLRPSERLNRSRGLRLQSQLEIVLIMLGSSKRKRGKDTTKTEQDTEREKINMFKKWMVKFQKVKQEFAAAKVVFEAQRSLLANMDEVKMARTRMTLVGPSERKRELSEVERRHRLRPSEVNALELSLKTERTKFMKDLNDKRGQLSYLLSLRLEMEEVNGNKKRGFECTADHCSICFVDFDEDGHIGILGCGHMFCKGCTQEFMKRKDGNSHLPLNTVQCPTCRRTITVKDISYAMVGPQAPKRQRTESGKSTGEFDKSSTLNNLVQSNGNVDNEDTKTVENDVDEIQPVLSDQQSKNSRNGTDINSESISNEPEAIDSSNRRHDRRLELASTFFDDNAIVLGSIGGKTSAIVRLVRGIWNRDNSSKIVVFSEWNEVLSLINLALDLNALSVMDGSTVTSSIHFGKVVSSFKSQETGAVLLLPLKRAGAGLNIVEAQHVVLVEPSMDIALERQAVGRVHRIGQTRVTYVHRIVVEGTIEDQILNLGDDFRKEKMLNATVRFEDVLQGFDELLMSDIAETALDDAMIVNDEDDSDDSGSSEEV